MEALTQKERIILICLSSSPSNAKVIQTAQKQMTPESRLEAVYIGRSESEAETDHSLRENIRLAEEAGASVHVITGKDIAGSIAETARSLSVTDLYIGYSPGGSSVQKRSIPEQLVQLLPEVDVYIIPDRKASKYAGTLNRRITADRPASDILTVVLIMAAATFLSFLFDRSSFSNSNIVTIYILAVLVTSIVTSQRIYGLIAAILYILLFNFLFIEPRFTLLVYDSTYLVTYFVSLIAALLTGSLAAKMKEAVNIAEENAAQAKILLNTSEQLEKAQDSLEMSAIICRQLSGLLHRSVWFFTIRDGEVTEQYSCLIRSEDRRALSERDTAALLWTAENRTHSGALTKQYADIDRRWYSIHSEEYSYGILGIDMKQGQLSELERTLLLSVISEFTLSLNTARVNREKQETQIEAEKEHLRAGLLRSISHDLRTPLTAICGNAAHLSANSAVLSEEDRRKLYADLQENASWLAGQMENILSMTRLENDTPLRMSAENVEDVIEESLKHLYQPADGHTIVFERSTETVFAVMDAKMIMLVLVNLVGNALKYTPEGSTVTISYHKEGSRVCVTVADDGPGIPDCDKEHIFELYYTGAHTAADSFRSMGIGLNLCMAILKAHGETLEAADNVPHGAVFRFYLKTEEVTNHEELSDPDSGR
ncbi:MAG: DUF4118 domain-containing protein [Solobacterium sp.]|nr:DUF4118 domain-containing protein [Solobacterium sp.]